MVGALSLSLVSQAAFAPHHHGRLGNQSAWLQPVVVVVANDTPAERVLKEQQQPLFFFFSNSSFFVQQQLN